MDEVFLDSKDAPVLKGVNHKDQASERKGGSIEEKIMPELKLEATEPAEIGGACLVPSTSADITQYIQHPASPPFQAATASPRVGNGEVAVPQMGQRTM